MRFHTTDLIYKFALRKKFLKKKFLREISSTAPTWASKRQENAVGDDALTPLKKLYISFGDTMVLGMIDHLRLKMAIKMTTAQKLEYRTTGYNNPWDPTTSITAYFTQLDRFQVSLGDRGIATSEDEKTMAAGAQMWNSEMFTEDQMVAWENKTVAQQTWAALQTYITDKWLERKQ